MEVKILIRAEHLEINEIEDILRKFAIIKSESLFNGTHFEVVIEY